GAAGRAQRRQQQPGQLVGGGDVDGEVPFPLRGAQLLDAAVDEDPRRVHEAREAGGQLERRDRGGRRLVVGELGDERLGRGQRGGERGQGVRVPPGEDQVVIRGELRGDSAPDPAGRPRDEHGGARG